MTGEATPSIGDHEFALLRWLADQPRGATVGETSNELGQERGWARTTVLTMMERLRGKGLLEREAVGGVFRYRATASPGQLERNAVGAFVERTLAGSFSPLVAYLVEAATVSAAELAELEALVASLQAKKPKGDEP